MENGKFTVEFNSDNGGLKSLVLKNDSDRMNWIEGPGTWGVPAGMEFLGAEQKDGKSVSRYRRDVLELTVERSMGGDFLREHFIFRNTAPYDLYFQRGELGVFATFNDNYTDAGTCEKAAVMRIFGAAEKTHMFTRSKWANSTPNSHSF